MVALRLAYAAPPAPRSLPVARRLRLAWALIWVSAKAHLGDRYGVPRPPSQH